MAEQSKIEWTDHTFNPWEGCQKVAPECDHCYAENRDQRFTGGIHWGPKAPRRRTSAQNWSKPRRWNAQAEAFHATHGRRQRVFCASLADVFDNAVDTSWREDLWALIRECDHLDWLLLTKRPQNIAKMLPPDWGDGWPHVWLGASAGTQKTADQNIPHLLKTPAAVRFVSAEPMLGPVDLVPFMGGRAYLCDCGWQRTEQRVAFQGNRTWCFDCGTNHQHFPTLDWVICGGESGSKARPMHPDWTRDLRDQCAAAGVAFFFKQWGEWVQASHDVCPDSDMSRNKAIWLGWDGRQAKPYHAGLQNPIGVVRVGKTAAGRSLDGQQWNEVPRGPLEGDAPCQP